MSETKASVTTDISGDKLVLIGLIGSANNHLEQAARELLDIAIADDGLLDDDELANLAFNFREFIWAWQKVITPYEELFNKWLWS